MRGLATNASVVARDRVDRIKVGVEAVWQLVVESYQARDWEALGYPTWDEMCTREFGTSRLRLPREERQEIVSSLREHGLSLRAIAAATGDSEPTVRRALGASFDAPVPNGAPDDSPALITARVESDDDWSDFDRMADATEDEFEAALTASRELGDMSRENVINNLPLAAANEPPPSTPVTGIDGKTYQSKSKREPYRKPLPDAAKSAGWELRKAMDRIEKLFDDNRYRQNEEQVATALRGHLLHVAETVAAVLEQLPN